ncbi:DUF928 domain-containing protein [Aetokthonos hydrillicola Thurmond2011]|jgi:hypothetical protein|uniref:DUF928 domain-containing protein n=1 Tax=Aetokthonos hydrillicola Thurmond2011 TaxID=2712845 RepID=A0AAP5IBG9_9CYAN|nr:DUF928 domain-containing protein [Aetokthonos hydrillicola]MBO3458653.1 DUF928 domain-containing protein [Aetokthonos hydrillicola CCALA 1050]MBW4588006.1 DUF928 domain-containing protein [Aetokthonos hydrillicola CCALA 1050]MDR9897042.1 DUF928 domain-containing protein [Aetokthonos hydrillicola Thurmond2011]
MRFIYSSVLLLFELTNCLAPVQAQIATPSTWHNDFLLLAQTRNTPTTKQQTEVNNPQPLHRESAKEASKINFIPPQPPYYEAPSGRRKGGASRCANCNVDELALTALVPGNQSQSFLALTIAKYPTFWFYIPHTFAHKASLEFVLQDEHHNYIYKTILTPSTISGGIISIPASQKAAPLVIGKKYQWTLSIREQQNSVFVQGYVQRVALNSEMMNKLESANSGQRLKVYAANGIWQDTLTLLANLHRKYPHDTIVKSQWISLLQSVGLEDIASERIIDCCNRSNYPAQN